MDIQAIADRLVALNRNNEYETAHQELYDLESIVSIENWGDREEYVGIDAVKRKGEEWQAMVEEMHEVRVSEPLVADHSFAVIFYMDATFSEKGGTQMAGRMQFTELAVYRVNAAGKTYHEEFFA